MAETGQPDPFAAFVAAQNNQQSQSNGTAGTASAGATPSGATSPTPAAETPAETSAAGETQDAGAEAGATNSSQYYVEPVLLSRREFNEAEYNRRVNRYRMLPGESAYDMVVRNTPRPKTLDPKDEKRQKLFAALGDMGLLLSDAITVGKGGLIPKRGSVTASTLKAIEAEKARDAKALAEYNKLLREAMTTDAKTRAELNRKGLAAGDAYIDDLNRHNDAVDRYNAGAITRAETHAMDAAIDAANAAENRALRHEALGIQRQNAISRAKRSGSGTTTGNGKIVIKVGSDTYRVPKLKWKGVSNNALLGLAQKAAEYDFNLLQDQTRYKSLSSWWKTQVGKNVQIWGNARKSSGLSEDEAFTILSTSYFITTEEGKAALSEYLVK